MIQRRVLEAGIETEIGCHSFRATGNTVYLKDLDCPVCPTFPEHDERLVGRFA